MPEKSEKRGRGRPAHKPNPRTRRDVSIAAGGGMPHEEIAIAMGISTDTLRKYYEDELSVGANIRRMEALKGLHKAAKRGSSSAAKAYLANMPEVVAPPIAPGDPASPRLNDVPAPAGAAADQAAATPEALGKKERANLEAKTAQVGTDWSELLDGPTTPVQ